MIPKPDSCVGCALHSGVWGRPDGGFSQPDGTGTNGVLIVAEALGESEEKAGIPLVGKVGHFFFSQLSRVGIERDNFRIFNTIACRPPDNKLAKMPWEKDCIQWCAPNLDRVIAESRSIAQANGKTFTILTLGKIAFKRIMGITEKDPIMTQKYQNYPFWSDRYQAWVIAIDHPSFIIRGNSHLIPVMQFGVQRALEIASHGMTLAKVDYILDPPPFQFASWVKDFKSYYESNPDTYLSYDIETPMKQGNDEEEVSKEEDNDYTILRCSFTYRPNTGASVPWRPEYFHLMADLFGHPVPKVGWNNENYDAPRVSVQTPLAGDQIDSMLAWHVLNTSLPKGLGYVTPFYVPDTLMWKHLSNAEPAFYNAKDADMALRNWLGIRDDLKENGLWNVFNRHVIEVNRVFFHMRNTGLLRDEEMRQEAETRLSKMLSSIKSDIEGVIPTGARNLKIYQKTPKDVSGMITVPGHRKAKKCTHCNVLDVKAAHFKSIGKKKLKSGESENPCIGSKSIVEAVPTMLWALPQEFKISNKSMQSYQKAVKHRPIIDPKEKKITFNEKALYKLMKFYPMDKLYPLVLRHREVQGLLSKYIGITEDGKIRGGLTVDKNGIIRTQFTHNPSTLRSAAQNPPLQQLPRVDPKNPDALGNIIRRLVVARPGTIFTARDYSGIEAVLVGYFAGLKDYIRLAKMDVHSFYTAYALNQLDGRVHSNDLPLLSWDDDRLRKRLNEIKKEFAQDRNALYKHLIHGANFMQGAKGAAEKILNETGIEYPVGKVQRVMNIYFDLFPGIKTWHSNLMLQAEKDGYLRNPFGYIHRFSRVFEYESTGGGWRKEPGPDANKVIAFLPQSTAAGMIKEAMLRLFYNRFEEAGQFIRLLVHDELFFETPLDLRDSVDRLVQEEMEKPVPELPLPPKWGMGESLVILTEDKQGPRWGDMR